MESEMLNKTKNVLEIYTQYVQVLIAVCEITRRAKRRRRRMRLGRAQQGLTSRPAHRETAPNSKIGL